MDQVLWLLRVALISGGSALTARGIGDAAMWEAAVPAVVALVGAVWSYVARRQALAAPPPGMEAQLAELARQAMGRR